MVEFSVIIPTYNRPQVLAACLDSFLALDFPAAEWELIVVNDGGEGSFTAVSPQHHARLPLQLLTTARRGPAAARNHGAQHARGRWLAFTDDDCRVTPEWLHAWQQGFAQTGSHALGGQSRNPFPANAAAEAAQWLVDFMIAYMRHASGSHLLLLSNNAAYSRDVFHAVGGFDTTIPLAGGEDLELSHRLVRCGYRQHFWPPAQVWHHHRMSLRRHMAQQFRYGRGGYYFDRVQAKWDGPLAVAARHTFYRTMVQALWQQKRPFSQWLILGAGQAAFQMGRRYERWQR